MSGAWRAKSGIRAIFERISRCQIWRRTSVRGMTDDPMMAGGPVQETGGSNRTPPGSGNVTGEKVHPAGARMMTEGRETTEEKRENKSE